MFYEKNGYDLDIGRGPSMGLMLLYVASEVNLTKNYYFTFFKLVKEKKTNKRKENKKFKFENIRKN